MTDANQLQRTFQELLQELRVVQTGVQILAGFLLTLPFTNRWDSTTTLQKGVYATALAASACATALVIGPVSYHRGPLAGDKERLLHVSIHLARLGMACLLVAASAAIFLAIDVAIGRLASLALTVPVVAVFVFVWYVLPRAGYRRG